MIDLNIWFSQLKTLNFQESIEINGSKCKVFEKHFPYLEKIAIGSVALEPTTSKYDCTKVQREIFPNHKHLQLLDRMEFFLDMNSNFKYKQYLSSP